MLAPLVLLRSRRRGRSPVFLTIMFALLYRLLQFSLLVSEQGINLACVSSLVDLHKPDSSLHVDPLTVAEMPDRFAVYSW